MRILVTGGAGFIGSHLVDALIEDGHTVRVLDVLVPEVHPTRMWPVYRNTQAECLRGALSSLSEDACVGIDAVFHCAARLGVQRSFQEPQLFCRDNVEATGTLLLAAAKAGVQRFVLSSSMGVYGENVYACPNGCGTQHPVPRVGDQLARQAWEIACPECEQPMHPIPTPEHTDPAPTSVYSLSKYAQEQLVRQLHQAGVLGAMRVVVLRYFNAYGPRQALSNPYSGVGAIFAAALQAGERPTVYEDGQQTRDFVYVSDVVQANRLALTYDGQAPLIANIGGEAASVGALARVFALELGRPEVQPKIVGIGRPGDIRHSMADTHVAEAVLGYEPKVRIVDGVRQTVAWIRQDAEVRS